MSKVLQAASPIGKLHKVIIHIIDIDDNSVKHRKAIMVGVVLYSKNYVQTNEVKDFCILKLKTL